MELIFKTAVADGIRGEVLSAFNAVPRRGAEAGGILVGRRVGNRMEVEDFEPVVCEHRFGPSFVLSEADVSGLVDSLQWFRKREGMAVLGVYRSHTRDGFAPEECDTELLDRYLAREERLLLLLRPDRRQNVAAKCFWRAAGLEAISEEVQFAGEQPIEMALPEAAETVPELALAASAGVQQSQPEVCLAEARPAQERPAARARARLLQLPAEFGNEPGVPAIADAHDALASEPATAEDPQPPRERRRGWTWLAAVFVVSVLGGILGYRSAAPSRQSTPVRTALPEKAATVADTAPARSPFVPPSPGTRDGVADRGTPEPETAVEAELRDTLSRWTEAMRSGNAEAIASFYGEHVSPYFNARNADRAMVARTVTASIARYGRPVILRLSEARIAPQTSDRAAASFRKHWQTSGPRAFAGEEDERLQFERQNGAWKIVSEQELHVFWTHRTGAGTKPEASRKRR